MRKADLITGVVFLVFTIVAFAYLIPYQIVSSIPIDESTPAVLRPEFFPQFTMVLFAITCVLMMGAALKNSSGERLWDDAKGSLTRVCAVLALTFLFVQALKLLGFAYTSPFFMATIIYMLGIRDWRLLVSTAILFPLFLTYFFWYSFQVVLPEGSLFP